MKPGRTVGGDPFLGMRAKAPVSDHDHVGHMVFPLDADRVARTCYCSGCGQVWELRFEEKLVGGVMKSVPVAWVPERADL